MAAYKGAGVTPVGPGIDEPLATIRSGAVYYYHADERGSIKAITDGSGTVVSAIQYTAFGRPIHIGSYPGDGTWASGYAYTGREWDAETGLYFYRARYYDAEAGRFITKDPIGFVGGMNLYAYVAGNPVNYTDPWGLKDKSINNNPWACLYGLSECPPREKDPEYKTENLACPGEPVTPDQVTCPSGQWKIDNQFGLSGAVVRGASSTLVEFTCVDSMSSKENVPYSRACTGSLDCTVEGPVVTVGATLMSFDLKRSTTENRYTDEAITGFYTSSGWFVSAGPVTVTDEGVSIAPGFGGGAGTTSCTTSDMVCTWKPLQ